MLFEERADYILRKLEEKNLVKTNDLVEEMNVSIDTIRRDLKKLEEEGKIFVLRPLIPTVSRLEKDYDTLMNFYNHGYKLMEKQYDAMMKYLEE